MRDEIVITNGHDKPPPIAPILPIDRHERQTLPLFIQQSRILRSSIVQSKLLQLVLVIHIQEAAIFGRRDGLFQLSALFRRCDGLPAIVEFGLVDGGRGGNVEDVDVSVDALCRLGAAAVAAVAGEDEELRGGDEVDFALGGCTGVLVFTRLFCSTFQFIA